MSEPGSELERSGRHDGMQKVEHGLVEERPSGPNLVLLYSILAFALLVAMGCAALIVLPFYHRR